MYSSLTSYINLTPQHFTSPRQNKVDTITPHCTAGNKNNKAKQLVDYFYNLTRNASCNYVIGGDGSIGVCVDENDRSWCSSNPDNDNRAITIEIASDNVKPYVCNREAIDAFINLCIDICKRYNKNKLVWNDNKEARVNHLNQQTNEMWLTVHRDYANKSCPGDFIYAQLGEIADRVNEQLSSIVISKEDLNVSTSTNENTKSLTKIADKSVIPQNIMEQVFKDRKINEFLDIIPVYYEAEKHYGIRADIALCQSLLETNNFKFTGRVPKSANNFGGLGAIDRDSSAYAVFGNHFLGAVAEMQHLFAYACTTDPVKKYPDWVVVDPRFNLVSRGCAEYVEWLGQKENPKGKGWATAKDYGYNIMKWYKEIYDKYMTENKADAQEPKKIEIPEVLRQPYVPDLSERVDTPDYIVQINPTKIYKYEKPITEDTEGVKIIGIVERSRQTIIEEQNGFGLLADKSGWIQLCFTTYITDADENKTSN